MLMALVKSRACIKSLSHAEAAAAAASNGDLQCCASSASTSARASLAETEERLADVRAALRQRKEEAERKERERRDKEEAERKERVRLLLLQEAEAERRQQLLGPELCERWPYGGTWLSKRKDGAKLADVFGKLSQNDPSLKSLAIFGESLSGPNFRCKNEIICFKTEKSAASKGAFPVCAHR